MKRILCTLMLLVAYLPLQAQSRGEDPIAKYTFPPELIMKHQSEIGLSQEQKAKIKKEVQTAQAKFTDLQWDLEGEMENLVKLIQKERVDEQQTLAALKRVLDLESQIKQTHLLLAIRIKNILTPQQQATLQKLKPHFPQMPAPPQPPGPPGHEK
ncbi:MAG: periplasmic heavy metal sensor [Calditrichaeota bacterium]|nr:MAG: periplasmic heavy metal sensor [Calditrichota bacterium]